MEAQTPSYFPERSIFTSRVEHLKPPLTGVRSRKSVTLDVVEAIQWIFPTRYEPGWGVYQNVKMTRPQPAVLEDINLSEYAPSVPLEFVGFCTVSQLQGIAEIDGQKVAVHSHRYYSGTYYIDAIRYTLLDALQLPDINQDLVKDLGYILNIDRIVKTRLGTLEPMYPEDQIIYTSPTIS